MISIIKHYILLAFRERSSSYHHKKGKMTKKKMT